MSWIKSTIKTISTQLIIVIIILEVIGIWQRSPDYFWEYRYLFYSPNATRQIDPGLWTYQPNSNIRSVVSYALPRSKAWIEYDCRFKSNSLGLIDTNYTHSKEIDWLVLGDSFTEGHGGCPWLTRESIEKSKIKNNIILNGGIQGTGILQFEKLLKYISRDNTIKNVVVIAISNDFKRLELPPNYWDTQRECLVNMNCTNNNYWWAINSNEAENSIVSITKKRAALRNNSGEWRAVLEYYSFAYSVFRKAFLITKSLANQKNINLKDLSENPAFTANFKALERIRQSYPRVHIILIPQKDETGIIGHKNLDTEIVENYLSSHSYSYNTCKIGNSDYMPIDGHPNDIGYKKIFNCLEEIISKN